jgi:hypothetical protein
MSLAMIKGVLFIIFAAFAVIVICASLQNDE